jgi:prolyl-tRNA synthetase
MRRSDAFLPTSRETRSSGTEATKLLVRAGLIREFGSGLWGFSPAGERIRRKATARVRKGMESVGAQAVQLPGLQHRRRWEQSGRWANFEDEMFTLQNRDGQDMCLAPSHEEGMVHLLDGRIRSERDLPLVLYQVASKFRDDHARNGLVRCKEFTMKDAYSFHADREGLVETYRRIRGAYEGLLEDVGLEFAVVEADNAVMGGSASEEFVAPVENGSDRIRYCSACRFGRTDEHAGFADLGEECPECGAQLRESDGIEVGHVFQLGDRYSSTMELTVDDHDGGSYAVEMGSYGLGIDRTIQALLQQRMDSNGCRWPVTDWGSIAPYHASVIPVGYEESAIREVADDLHAACGESDVLLFDDETQSVGERFAESDLLGIPAKVVVGNGYRETGNVDVETRDGETRRLAPEAVPGALERFGTELAD